MKCLLTECINLVSLLFSGPHRRVQEEGKTDMKGGTQKNAKTFKKGPTTPQI